MCLLLFFGWLVCLFVVIVRFVGVFCFLFYFVCFLFLFLFLFCFVFFFLVFFFGGGGGCYLVVDMVNNKVIKFTNRPTDSPE